MCRNNDSETENECNNTPIAQQLTDSDKQKTTFKKTVKDLAKMWLFQSLPRNYIENFEVSAERNLRDIEITQLLRVYVIMYRIKVVTIRTRPHRIKIYAKACGYAK